MDPGASVEVPGVLVVEEFLYRSLRLIKENNVIRRFGRFYALLVGACRMLGR